MPTYDDLRRLGGAADQGAEPRSGAVWNAFFGGRKSKGKGEVIKTLIDSFQYPRLGPGQMWEAARDKVRPAGGAVHMDRRRRAGSSTTASAVTAFVARDAEGRRTRYLGQHFLSTLPIRDLIRAMSPAAPPEVVEAAESLKYRDFLTVVLIVDRAETFPDTWIYIHEPDVRVGRVQNFKNWSPDLVPDPSKIEPRPRILLLRGGRPLDDVRRRPDRARPPRDRRDRPGRRPTDVDRRLRRPDAQGVPGLRRRLPGPPGRDPRLAREAARTSSWPAATACTSTTTRTTR